jgi:hypothetical protein
VKYLLYVDAALAALGVAMTVSISYVCLVYGIFQHSEPSMRAGFPSLLVVSACFLALAVAGSCATYGLWKRRSWNWKAQTALGILLPVLYLIVDFNLKSA